MYLQHGRDESWYRTARTLRGHHSMILPRLLGLVYTVRAHLGATVALARDRLPAETNALCRGSATRVTDIVARQSSGARAQFETYALRHARCI
jgi:hypothetical protein